jgi:hypothetical protein
MKSPPCTQGRWGTGSCSVPATGNASADASENANADTFSRNLQSMMAERQKQDALWSESSESSVESTKASETSRAELFRAQTLDEKIRALGK